MIQSLKERARELKREVIALYFVAKDPETPWAAKALAWLVAAYALSPIDLIPDFIPVLGCLDDLILIPLGVKVVLMMIPPHVMERARLQAAQLEAKPRSLTGAVTVILMWLSLMALLTFRFILG